MKNELLLFRFDTHYPDYFPPRSNFKAVVAALQSMGVAVFPYINGRIFEAWGIRYAVLEGYTHGPEMEAQEDPTLLDAEVHRIVAEARPNQIHERGEPSKI